MPQRRKKKPPRGQRYIFVPLRLCVKQNSRTYRHRADGTSAGDRLQT
jgi:hypothetical protein